MSKRNDTDAAKIAEIAEKLAVAARDAEHAYREIDPGLNEYHNWLPFMTKRLAAALTELGIGDRVCKWERIDDLWNKRYKTGCNGMRAQYLLTHCGYCGGRIDTRDSDD